MVNYVSKFIRFRPLNKNGLWEWSENQENYFLKFKEILKNTPKLVYFDVNKPTVISADVSSHAVDAVLLQNRRPIVHATKPLTDSRQRYPQIEKKCFAYSFWM